MKRRIVITLLTAALTVSLTACGNKAAVAPADNSSTDVAAVADTATEEAPSSEEASDETKEPVALRQDWAGTSSTIPILPIIPKSYSE